MSQKFCVKFKDEWIFKFSILLVVETWEYESEPNDFRILLEIFKSKYKEKR